MFTSQQLVGMQSLPGCIGRIPDLVGQWEESEAISRLGKKPQMTEENSLWDRLTVIGVWLTAVGIFLSVQMLGELGVATERWLNTCDIPEVRALWWGLKILIAILTSGIAVLQGCVWGNRHRLYCEIPGVICSVIALITPGFMWARSKVFLVPSGNLVLTKEMRNRNKKNII